MEKNKWIKLGVCGKAHGIKGGFQFNLENSEDSVLQAGAEILLKPSTKASSLDSKGETWVLNQISFGHKVMAFLEGVDNRNQVEEMIPFEIYMDRSHFPELDEDEVYLSDLVGMEVFNHHTGDSVGVIDHFYDNTAQPILVIKGKRKLELPFIDHFFPVVDLENNRIEIVVPEVIE